ncbi:MAG: excinuclease ABC subunit UvrC [Deltaproteobacteria bacterium]|nr:excinuclease ABC subunit UvrC [Deltaproteobacteria bacterium]
MYASLREKSRNAPPGPGVYIMRDCRGSVIYVGKAASLKKRLASYFSNTSRHTPKTGILVTHIFDFDTLVTATENEALILESNLIKKYKPKYNVILKDDKRYPSLRIDLSDDYPRISVVRRIKNDGALYFGPYASAGAVRQTLKIIGRTFKLRKCRSARMKQRSRPCLNYQIGACLGPCCRNIDPDDYKKIVEEVRMFLNGHTSDLVKKIELEMNTAAEKEDFEDAAALRDKMFALRKTIEKQVIVTNDFSDRDVIALARNKAATIAMIMIVRNGCLSGNLDFTFDASFAEDGEILSAFVRHYYAISDYIPSEILIALEMEDRDLCAEWLSLRRGRKVRLIVPRRGDKVRLVSMAVENAKNRLSRHMEESAGINRIFSALLHRLNLKRLPNRIECVDNSGIQGQDMVSGLVVFENGKEKKKDYRRYILKTVSGQDDYAAMREVLTRRFKKGGNAPLPDLLMVDGGKGQLNIAVSVLRGLDLDGKFAVIGIAKKDEKKGEEDDKIFIYGRANPVNFLKDRHALFFLQKIRDEAHRFAITFHRTRRRGRALGSMLDNIPGIGPKRKASIMKVFFGPKQITAAGINGLASLPSMNREAARAVIQAFETVLKDEHRTSNVQRPTLNNEC